MLEYEYEISFSATAPLILLVHGQAGNKKAMSIFKSAFPVGCNFLMPEAPLADPKGGFSWWLDKEYKNYDQASIALFDFLTFAIKQHDLRPDKVIACGFSQGGAVLSWLSQREPELFTGIALIASFYLLDESTTPSVYPEFFITHGTQDEIVSVSRALDVVFYLVNKGVIVQFVSDLTGHKIGRNGMKAFKFWAKEQLGRSL